MSNERDIAAEEKALLNESADLEEMAESLKGAEFDAALQLDQKAAQGVMELDATVNSATAEKAFH